MAYKEEVDEESHPVVSAMVPSRTFYDDDDDTSLHGSPQTLSPNLKEEKVRPNSSVSSRFSIRNIGLLKCVQKHTFNILISFSVSCRVLIIPMSVTLVQEQVHWKICWTIQMPSPWPRVLKAVLSNVGYPVTGKEWIVGSSLLIFYTWREKMGKRFVVI